MKLILKYIFSILFIYYNIYSLDLDSININTGIYSNFLINYHKTNFIDLPGIANCCTKYNNTTSYGLNTGIFAEIGIFKFLDLRLNFGYSTLGADLTSNEFIGNTEVNNELVHIFSEHNLETEINILNANPEISIKIEPFKVNVGILSGIMVDKSYYQHEDLADYLIDKGIVFYDGEKSSGTIRNESSGDLKEALLYHAITLGVSADIDFYKNFFLRPEVSYNYNLKNIVTTKYWRIDNFSFGVSIGYHLSNVHNGTELIANLSNIKTNENISTINSDSLIARYLSSNGSNCCFIIFASTKNVNFAESKLFDLKNENINFQVFIEEWSNPDTGVKYYRIRSACFPGMQQAIIEKDKINPELFKTAIIKCE